MPRAWTGSCCSNKWGADAEAVEWGLWPAANLSRTFLPAIGMADVCVSRYSKTEADILKDEIPSPDFQPDKTIQIIAVIWVISEQPVLWKLVGSEGTRGSWNERSLCSANLTVPRVIIRRAMMETPPKWNSAVPFIENEMKPGERADLLVNMGWNLF